MHREKKKLTGDPSRAVMSDTLSEASSAFQRRMKKGHVTTSVAPVFATDKRNFENRGLHASDHAEKQTSRLAIREQGATPPRRGLSPQRSASNCETQSRERVSSISKSPSLREKPSKPPLARRPSSTLNKASSELTAPSPKPDTAVLQLLTNIKLMKETLRGYMDVDQELSDAKIEVNDDPSIAEALWVVKRSMSEFAIMRTKISALETDLNSSKAMQAELSKEVASLSLTVSDLKQKAVIAANAYIALQSSHTESQVASWRHRTQAETAEAVAKAAQEELARVSRGSEGLMSQDMIDALLKKAVQTQKAESMEEFEQKLAVERSAHQKLIEETRIETAEMTRKAQELAQNELDATVKKLESQAATATSKAIDKERVEAAEKIRQLETECEEAKRSALERAKQPPVPETALLDEADEAAVLSAKEKADTADREARALIRATNLLLKEDSLKQALEAERTALAKSTETAVRLEQILARNALLQASEKVEIAEAMANAAAERAAEAEVAVVVAGRKSAAFQVADAVAAEREASEAKYKARLSSMREANEAKMQAKLLSETQSAVANALAREREAAAASVEHVLEAERKLNQAALEQAQKQANEANALAAAEKERALQAEALMEAEKKESAEAVKAAEAAARAEMDRLKNAVQVEAVKEQSKDVESEEMVKLKKAIELQQQQIDLLVTKAAEPDSSPQEPQHLQQPPPTSATSPTSPRSRTLPTSPTTSVGKNPSSTLTLIERENNAACTIIWDLVAQHCMSKKTTMTDVWVAEFDRSQTGRNTPAQFTRGLERCGCRFKAFESAAAFEDIITKRRKKHEKTGSMLASTASVEEFVAAASHWVQGLDDSDRASIGLPMINKPPGLLDTFDEEECTFKPKVTAYKPPTATARKSRNSVSSTNTSTPRSKSPRTSLSRKREDRRKASIKEAPVFDLGEALANIIGQEKLKEQLLAFEKGIELQARRKELGIECSEQQPPHMMFCGNPGTGKTTIARLVGLVLKKLGVLKKGHLVEVQRSDLVAGAIGQTALKTRDKINEARGGVLFVDEAYTLAPGGATETKDFGREAINEIMSVMNDGDPVVIFAGYKKEMETFVQANAGLFRRIDVRYDFADYSTSELAAILRMEVTSSGFRLHDNIEDADVAQLLEVGTTPELRNAMGGGLSRQLFRKARGKLDAMLSLDSSPEEMCILTKDHLQLALADIAESVLLSL